mgnify:CR=1 FL=1
MKKIRIWVSPGIGDTVWVLTKISDMRKKLNINHVEMVIQSTEFNRADDFLMHFDFIDSTFYETFSIRPEPIYNIYGTDEEGQYIYYESTGNYRGDPNSWLLIANSHLEHGHRLETWYPEFKAEMDFAKHFNFREEEIKWAEAFCKDTLNSNPFIVFYMGTLNGNTINGHNRNGLWSLEDWFKVGSYLPSEYKIVIVGHQYDWQYANLFLEGLPNIQHYVNLCGKTTIGECFALIKRSQFILSYATGIGIFSAYLGHPSAMFLGLKGHSRSSEFFQSFEEDLCHCWCPTEYINKTYFPLIYTKCSPETVSKIMDPFL